MPGKAKSRTHLKEKEKAGFTIFIRLFTEERFPLKNVTNDMKIKDLKMYMEFATGVPVHMQRISYLDEGELLDHTDVRSNDIVPGATLQMRVWPMWKDLIEACATNDLDWVFRLGVTMPTDYHTAGSDYMTKKARKLWLKERAFLALYVASHRGHEKLVKMLIDAGADVDASTPLGRTALHVAAAQGHGHIVDLLLEKGADIDAEDESGETALTIAAKFGHKTCERHLFLFRWQERAKRTKPSKDPDRMAHQYFDSAFPVWKRGGQCQLYFSNILPPGEYEGTRFNSPKHGFRDDMQPDDEFEELKNIGRDGKLPAIREERRYRAKSGPARLGKARSVSYNDWLGRKKFAEQKIINVKKAEEEKKKMEEDERNAELETAADMRKRQEAEKSESYETWLASKEIEKKTTLTQSTRQTDVSFDKFSEPKSEGYLRSYLRSLDERRRGTALYSFEDWFNEKEATVLGIRRNKTVITS